MDLIRSYAPGFIFTTSLPPATVAGALASVRHLYHSKEERQMQQKVTKEVKARLERGGIPVLPNPSHIVPVMVYDAELCKLASDKLLVDHQIYVQPINYPTVPMGEERLRITPGPLHTPAMMDHLVSSLQTVWSELGMFFSSFF